MSTTTPRKPPTSSINTPLTTTRRQQTSTTNSSVSPARDLSPSAILSTNGIARSSSPRSPGGVTRPTRASVRRPGQSTNSLSGGSVALSEEAANAEDVRTENAALVENLKKSLRNSEMTVEDYQQQLAATQKRMDDLLKQQVKLEESLHESMQKVEDLEMGKRETSRQVREMGALFESERSSMLQDREEASAREMELKSSIQRLKETMAGREMRFMNADSERRLSRQGRTHSRSSSVDEHAFAPPNSLLRRDSSINRSDSRNATRVVIQKDLVIESLRLELADAQIKLVEMENMGGNHMQELERTLLETRMENARLMEDNESFQLLLGERTLNGDFTKPEFMQGSPNMPAPSSLGSLAEELESAEGESDAYRRLEAETRGLRDSNKALTLYIERIISRVLQHENFETILDQKIGAIPGAMKTQKDLPPPPPAKDDAPPSVLQRAMSVVGPRRTRPASQIFASAPAPPMEEIPARRPRPQTQIFSSSQMPVTSANEDPFTAPRVPIGRTQSVSHRIGVGPGHRRTHSEKSNELPIGTAAAVVNQMYRGAPMGSGGPLSPASPGSTPRTSFFMPSGIVGTTANLNRPSTGSRAIPGSRITSASSTTTSNTPPTARTATDNTSTFSRDSTDLPSSPRTTAGSTQYTGAVMAQNKLRPLRLVQENNRAASDESGPRKVSLVDDEAARKRANRGSWMGWFKGSKDGFETPTPTKAASSGSFPGLGEE